jgi:hypothetical protein
MIRLSDKGSQKATTPGGTVMSAIAQLLLTGLIGTVLPVAVGLVKNWATTSAAKGALLAALAALSGLLTQWLANPHLNLTLAALFALEGWVVAVATHFGLWKPVAVSASARRTRLH